MILILILFSCIDIGKHECEKYSIEILYDEHTFLLIGEHSLKMLRFTDKHGFTLKEVEFNSDVKLYNYKSDFEKIKSEENIDTLYFEISSSEINTSIRRDFTGYIYEKKNQPKSKTVCPNRIL